MTSRFMRFPFCRKAESPALLLVISLLLSLSGCDNTSPSAPKNPDISSSPITDTLAIGDNASEHQHGVQLGASERFTGGLGEPAVKLLPSGTKAWESAPMEFTMKVDAEKQNYITTRLWGSDKGEELGRLVLYIDGKQLGYRGAGDYSTLNQADAEAEAPGRFFYETLPLPPFLTKGKSTVSVKVIALGPRWWYGPTFETYQKPFTKESRGIYRFYTHTDGYFVPPPEEKQGEAPNASVRPAPGEEVMEQSRKVVLDRINRMLKEEITANSAPKAYQIPILFLAAAYNTEWTPAYHNPMAIERIVQLGDGRAMDFFLDNTWVSKNWIGAGPLGEAIIETWPEIGKRMQEKVQMNGNEITRGEAWSRLLKASVDYWRTHRRSYTNQSMIVDYNIYTANRGLSLIDPSLALPESHTLHFLYEAVGIEPWLGSDAGGENTGEKDVPYQNVAIPFGNNYNLITTKGVSRELGWVAGYGETILRFM